VRAIAYVDGFNLYYGLREKADERGRGERLLGWRWLDPSALAERLVRSAWPTVEIVETVYCTARIKARPGDDPSAPQRQDVYLRALAASGTTVLLGQFQKKVIHRPLRSDPSQVVAVISSEEKGSDVNLATRLLVDAFTPGRCDAAIVITNDSDLAMPVEIVRALGKAVAILNPRSSTRSRVLAPDDAGGPHVHEFITIRDALDCQLPDVVSDGSRRITRPPTW
jgi:hypothetical protein